MLSLNPVVDLFSIKFAICYLKLRCFFNRLQILRELYIHLFDLNLTIAIIFILE